MSKTKTIIFISLVAYFAILNFLRLNYLQTTILDDAYIFLRYAENIVNGYSFVWNIGESPVEGYSSFLYLVVLVVAKFLSIDLELFAILFGIITSSLTLFLVYLIYEHLYSGRLINTSATIFSIVVLTLSPAYLYWSSAGMETSFYSMFVVLTFYLFLKLPDTIKNNFLKGILFGLLCVIRFEAVLFFLAVLYYLTKAEGSFFKIIISKNSILFVLGFVIIFGTYFIWRWSFFGYFFPNTFYAKTGGGFQQIAGGFLYILKAMRLFFGFGWIPIIFVFLFARKRMIAKDGIFLFSVGLLSLLTTILLGGDHFHLGRFVLPVLPFLFVFLPTALDSMLSANLKNVKLSFTFKVTIIFIFLGVTLIIKSVYQETVKGFENLFYGKKEVIEVYDKSTETEIIDWQHGWIIMGSILKEIADKGDYIAAVPIGAIGYYSKMGMIDMVGIVDPVIAHKKLTEDKIEKWTAGHTKGDGEYILSRKPKFIQLTDYLTRTTLEEPHKRSLQFKSVREIWESEEFHQTYEFYPVEVLDGWYYNLFILK